MPWAARVAAKPMKWKQAHTQSSNAISLLGSPTWRTLDRSVLGRRSGHFFRLDGAHLGKDLSRLGGLPFGAKNQRKLIMRGGILVMRQRTLQHLLGAGVVVFDRICPAQLRIGRPEIGLAADCRLEMRNRLSGALFSHQNRAKFRVRFGMTGAEVQFAGQ